MEGGVEQNLVLSIPLGSNAHDFRGCLELTKGNVVLPETPYMGNVRTDFDIKRE
jgi:hypothetical protein